MAARSSSGPTIRMPPPPPARPDARTDRTFFQSARAESLDRLTRSWDGLADGAEIVEPSAGFDVA
ncbi:hypothetical protein [Microbacterium sp. TPD7012]|uniref:hypothetical protein n=1 Tax=Microbacterium sp. TPD7012 TaxID=2171975 RepID=UPI000D51D44C|nr:hypothetical protein [Microbacterium sp. TPD7012]PVE94139.1 hypothetical protein DC434_15420 [Microbacterium sp. TPD7012]